jgi:two-component system CheB/CheR fusion protein
MDPPFTKLEILICRNLMIYLTGDLQKKLLPLFHYSLNPGGVLFLGSAETIGNSTNLFTPLDNKLRLFRRLESIQVAGQPADLHETVFPALTSVIESERLPPLPQVPPPNLQMLVDQLIIQNYSPASVLVDDKGDILYISGRTGKYLEPAAGKANWNIFPMAREGIRQTLNTAFHKATREKTRVIYNNVTVGTNGGTQLLDIIVYPLEAPIALQGMVLIVFKDVAPPAIDSSTAKGKRGGVKTDGVLQLEQDLQRSHEELQITREEMQTTQEELKSSNEELQSTNEELQSTNEELTTSKEGCSP